MGDAKRRNSVLVVDDELAITDWLERMLSQQYEIRQANGVRAALAAIGTRPPDAIVTDLGMDEGGGEHLLAKVAVTHPDVVRVVYSAAPACSVRWMLDSGLAHAIVTKGGDLETVSKVLARLLAPNVAASR